MITYIRSSKFRLRLRPFQKTLRTEFPKREAKALHRTSLQPTSTTTFMATSFGRQYGLSLSISDAMAGTADADFCGASSSLKHISQNQRKKNCQKIAKLKECFFPPTSITYTLVAGIDLFFGILGNIPSNKLPFIARISSLSTKHPQARTPHPIPNRSPPML